ncbi:MAG: hypothetical protein TR69_WS6001000585 [candidate division WS6 bacterium OLB20]|uniref:Uncharacterized protein n=1 Tax=candidate division WS6 bacterium OLB20 TaxID=1617426 RepID=A0A136LY53_9BACT|nr:MAG: hypothetical protein TR69_WS6001000585 [candidate division WS6 bacterium OLB20]
MNRNSQTLIITAAALILFISGGVFAVMGLSSSASGNDPAVTLLDSIGSENQYRACSGSAAEVCFSWQYLTGSFADNTLTVGDASLTLSGRYNRETDIEEISRDLNVIYYSRPEGDQLTGYLQTDKDTFVTGSTGSCVEGAFFYFDRFPAGLDLLKLPVDDGHRGFLELYPCDSNPAQEQFFSYTRLERQLIDL